MGEVNTTPLDRLLRPFVRSLSPEAAKQLLDMQIDPSTEARISELAEKANEGLLSADERREYEEFVEGLDLIALLQVQARRSLSGRAS